jgi:hypothetical protein
MVVFSAETFTASGVLMQICKKPASFYFYTTVKIV